MKKQIRISSGFIGSRRGFLIEVERAEQRNWKHHQKRAILSRQVGIPRIGKGRINNYATIQNKASTVKGNQIHH